MYHPLEQVEELETHGQCWHGESVEEGIALCPVQHVEKYFRKYLPKNGKILEAGCGLGRWVFYFRSLGYDIVGIELADNALAMAWAYDPTASILKGNVLHTNFPNEHFQAILSLGVVEHFEEGPWEAFRETRRLLTPGGVFLVAVPIQNLSRRLLANPLKTLKRWMKERCGGKYAFEEYRYTVRQFSTLLVNAGFEIVECVPDELQLPRNIGLYVDYPFLRDHRRKWQLNPVGVIIAAILHFISPWLACGGALWVCRKPR
jgi:SAM-dependent methyltransferase